MELIEKLNWRFATKAMNGQKVPQEKVDKILEAARLAPTSSGLQPLKSSWLPIRKSKNRLNLMPGISHR
jgi:nitroreductase